VKPSIKNLGRWRSGQCSSFRFGLRPVCAKTNKAKPTFPQLKFNYERRLKNYYHSHKIVEANLVFGCKFRRIEFLIPSLSHRFVCSCEWNGKHVWIGGEWIMNGAKIPASVYAKLPAQFDPVKFHADEWGDSRKRPT